MPPDEYRSEGTPSPSEEPYARGEPFWVLFWRLKKVPRRKGETISRRYRSNGYVPHQNPGRLSGRLRRQASSHSWTGCIRERLVGCQAAIASKLAPTVLIGVHLEEIGWLVDRFRRQASCHSLERCTSCGRLVGCQAAFAGRPAPTVWSGVHPAGDWSAVRPPSQAGQLPQFDRYTPGGTWSALRPPSPSPSPSPSQCAVTRCRTEELLGERAN